MLKRKLPAAVAFLLLALSGGYAMETPPQEDATSPFAWKTDDVIVLPNGEWRLQQVDANNGLVLETRRLPATHSGLDDELRRLVLWERPEADGVTIDDFPEMTERLDRPVRKAWFTVGTNEDARYCLAALAASDGWHYWFVLEAPVDLAIGPEAEKADDAGVAAGLLRETMEKTLAALPLSLPEDCAFSNPAGTPVYVAAMDTEPGISVMDALLRIKQTARPETGIPPGRAAYRHDGVGMVGDRPAQLFSFGADSREKFTAERHFAVTADGFVYEMNPVAGPDYMRIDETVCFSYAVRPIGYRDVPSPDGRWLLSAEGGEAHPTFIYRLGEAGVPDEKPLAEFGVVKAGEAVWIDSVRFILTVVDGVRDGGSYPGLGYGLRLSVVMHDTAIGKTIPLETASSLKNYLLLGFDADKDKAIIREESVADEMDWTTPEKISAREIAYAIPPAG